MPSQIGDESKKYLKRFNDISAAIESSHDLKQNNNYQGENILQSALFGKNFITTEDWSNDGIGSLLDVIADLKLGFFGFCTNSPYNAGIAGVLTIGFDPGTKPDAHMFNERMKVSETSKAAEGYFEIIQVVLK